MANEQHLKLINEAIEKHDIAIWNKWRQENPDIRPDLSGADLRRADLKKAIVHGVIFRDALLLGALLFGADLNKANLEDNVKKLSQSQIRTAKNWETAYYCKGILEDLGLPLGHNETLRKGIEEKKAKE